MLWALRPALAYCHVFSACAACLADSIHLLLVCVCVLQNEKTATVAKLQTARTNLAHAKADKVYFEEQLATVSARLRGVPCSVPGVGLAACRAAQARQLCAVSRVRH